MKLNKNGRLSKGKKSKAKQKHTIEMHRQDTIVKRFSKINDKSANCRAMYCIAGVVKQRTTVTRESKSINCPVSRFTSSTKKDSRKPYKITPETWVLSQKPKEWVRLNHRELNVIKIGSGIRFW